MRWANLIGAALTAAICTSNADAQTPPSRSLIGDWTHVTLTEAADSEPNCRYVRIVVRDYHIEPGWNNEVSGSYLRHYWHLWIHRDGLESDQCASGRRREDLPGNRSDSWNLSGVVNSGGGEFRAIHSGCDGACDDGTELQDEFVTTLRLAPEGAWDIGKGTGEGAFRLIGRRRALDEGEAANEALDGLLQPLSDGNCNLFYAQSLDRAFQEKMPSDVFCRGAAPFATLLGQALYRAPMPIIIRVSSALLHAGPNALILGDGDVLVVTKFVLNRAGGGFSLIFVMRRHAEGWRLAGWVA